MLRIDGGLLGCWLYTNIWEEHTASIFRAEVRSVGKWMVYIGLGGSSGHGDWPVIAME
jgi:hypothetical protein